MRKILIGLLFLIGWSVQAQIVPASQVQISQFGRLKKLTVKPAAPVAGFGNFYNLNDSLHYEISTKDWNLGKITYTDTLGYYLLKADTIFFLHTSDLAGLQDSLVSRYLYDANTILKANVDNTPVPVTISVQQVVGRATGGTIRGLDIDSDLSSVSTGDSTIPSAKAAKAMGDLKALKTTTISTTAPLTGGGDLSANRTLVIPNSTTTVDGYLSGANFTIFNNKMGSLANNQWMPSLDYVGGVINILKVTPDNTFAFGLPVEIGALYSVANQGIQTILNMPVTTFCVDNTPLGFNVLLGNQKIMEIWGQYNSATGLIDNFRVDVLGIVKGHTLTDSIATLSLGALRGATDVFASDSIQGKNIYAQDTVKANHFRMVTGASNGYIMKTDANGIGTWQMLTSSYKGTWNATTNTPTLSDATGANGDFYIVSTGGTQNLGHGNVTFVVGGTAVHNGTKYEAVNPANQVTSVNSLQGDVQLDLFLSGDTLMLTGGTDSVNIALIPAFTLVKNRLTTIENDTLHYQAAYTHSLLTTGNPHHVSASDVGLGNVVNEAPAYFVHAISVDGENNIAVSFTITATSKVYYNGSLVENTRWTGAGSTTINLSLDTRLYDYLVITN